MSSDPGTRRRRRDPLSVPELPDVILRTESQGDLGDPGLVVAEAEARASVSARPNVNCSKRMRAKQLHQEADQLYYKGDYESALVLYHRAARLCPRENSHSVAAWRIQAAISSAANPSQELNTQLKETRSSSQASAVLLPEVAARRAGNVVAESNDPVRDIPRILRFFESRKDFWRLASPSTSPRRTRSKMMVKHLNRCVTTTFKELETAYEAGDATTVYELGDVLMNLASVSEESERNQLDLYGFLANRQIRLRRHDRAVNLAVKMIFLARTCGNVLWVTEALVTIGKVHLAFGHLDALLQVWQRFVEDLDDEPIPQAWLYHDIGRCHLELGNFENALEMAKLCLDRAESGQSRKWMIRGHLLTGQSLLKLNRFAEAVVALKAVTILALNEKKKKDRKEKDKSIILYVQDLIDQVTGVLRQLNQEQNGKADSRKSYDRAIESDSPTNLINKNNKIKEREIPKVEELNLGLLENEPSPRKQRRRQNRCWTYLDNQEDTSDEEKVAELYRRSQAIHRGQSLIPITTSNDKSVKAQQQRATAVNVSALLSSGAREADGEDTADMDLNLESSRTRIIRRCDSERNSDDERTLRADELLPLSDTSCLEDTGEEDFTSARLDDETFEVDKAEAILSGMNSDNTMRTAHAVISVEKSASYFSPEEGLTSPSLSFSMDSENNFDSQRILRKSSRYSVESYLKSLNPSDFEQLRKDEGRFFEERLTD